MVWPSQSRRQQLDKVMRCQGMTGEIYQAETGRTCGGVLQVDLPLTGPSSHTVLMKGCAHSLTFSHAKGTEGQ